MAILTRNGMTKLLRRIMETGGMSEAMESDIQRLRDDFDEREGMLRRYGETYDGEEDVDEYNWAPREDTDSEYKQNETGTEGSMEGSDEVFTPREEEKDWRQEYENMRQRYLDRFFGTEKVEDTNESIMDETEDDVKRDGTRQSFETLFKRVEGD